MENDLNRSKWEAVKYFSKPFVPCSHSLKWALCIFYISLTKLRKPLSSSAMFCTDQSQSNAAVLLPCNTLVRPKSLVQKSQDGLLMQRGVWLSRLIFTCAICTIKGWTENAKKKLLKIYEDMWDIENNRIQKGSTFHHHIAFSQHQNNKSIHSLPLPVLFSTQIEKPVSACPSETIFISVSLYVPGNNIYSFEENLLMKILIVIHTLYECLVLFWNHSPVPLTLYSLPVILFSLFLICPVLVQRLQITVAFEVIFYHTPNGTKW